MTHPPAGPSTPPPPSGPKTADPIDVDLTLEGDEADREYELAASEALAAMSDEEYAAALSPLHNFADVVPGVEAALIEQLALLTQDLEVLPRRGGWQDLVVAAEVHGVVVELVEMALVELARIKTPAHRDPSTTAVGTVATTGGPVQPPAATGKEPTPGSAAALSGAARGSAGAVVAPGAGADVLPGGPPSPDAGADDLLPEELADEVEDRRSGGSFARHYLGPRADFRLPRDIRGGLWPSRPGDPPPPPPQPPVPPPGPGIGVGTVYDFRPPRP